MQALSLYRAALLMPLLLGAVVVALLALFGDVGWLNAALGDMGLFLVVAWWICGIPYVLLALGFWFWSKGRRPDLVRQGLLAWPLILAVLSVVWWFGRLLMNHGPEDRRFEWSALAVVGAKIVGIILIIGYLSVAIALLVARRMRHGQIRNDAA